MTTIGQSIGDNLVALKKPVSLMTKACPNQILRNFSEINDAHQIATV
jgi:hypothetical protein